MTGLLRASQKAKAKALGNKERQNQNPCAYAVVCLDTDDVVIDRMTPKTTIQKQSLWPLVSGPSERQTQLRQLHHCRRVIQMLNAVHAERCAHLDEERPVFDIGNLAGRNLRQIEREAVDLLIRLAQVDETR